MSPPRTPYGVAASAALALGAASLLVSCTGGATTDTRDAPPAPSPSIERRPSTEPSNEPPTKPRESPAPERTPLPRSPATTPAALADQLELAVATLRDESSSSRQVRAAGRLHQRGVRLVSGRPPAFERAVVTRLDVRTARVVRPAVRAGRELRALTEPQPSLPDWRIVAPPPPEELLAHYRRAERRTGVPWHHLAAIHLVETRMGRIRGVSVAGARGPMQFLPSTWDIYGGDGDIDDPADAVLAAGRLLRANGAPGDLRGALWHYNPSDHYVEAVRAHAAVLRRHPWMYRGYWHWQVIYEHRRGPHLLPEGYPDERARMVRPNPETVEP